MARIFSSGFEMNSNLVDTEFMSVNGGATIVLSPVRSGNYALRANSSGTAAGALKQIHATNQPAIGFQRIYINIASYPSTTNHIMRYSDDLTNPIAAIRLLPTGELELVNSLFMTVGASSPVLSLNTWHMVEFAIDASTDPGTLIARLNGTQFATGSNDIQGQWCIISVGMHAVSGGLAYFDDWAMNDASGTFQNSFPGPGRIVHISPNGRGDSATWAPAGGGLPATGWQAVAENPPDDPFTAVRSIANGNEDFYTISPSVISVNDTITLLQVSGRMTTTVTDATSSMAFQLKKASGGTIMTSADITPDLDLEPTRPWKTHGPFRYANYPLTAYRDPDSSPWTYDTLRTAQVGIKKTGGSASQMRVSMVWVLVEYTQGAPITPPLSRTTLLGVS